MKFTEILMAGQDANTRNAIHSAKKNYQIPWKVVHEALQNSLDAIYKTGREGHISITLDLEKQSVDIRDDGIGFPQAEKGKQLLGLHGSDKEEEPMMSGNLGYGIKTIICSTNYFKLTSRREGFRWGFEVQNGHNLDIAEFKEVERTQEDSTESGTELYYEFPNNEVTRFVNEIYAVTPGIQTLNGYRDTVKYLSKQGDYPTLLGTLVKWYFRTCTYAANIDRLISGDSSKFPKVLITFKIVCSSLSPREETDLVDDVYDVLNLSGEVFEVQFENKFWDIEEFFTDQNGKTKPGLPFSLVRDIQLPIPDSYELKKEQIVVIKANTIEEYQRMIRYPKGKLVSANHNDKYYENRVFKPLQGLYIIVGRKRFLDRMLIPGMSSRHQAFSKGIPTQDFIGLSSGQWESARSEFTILFAPNVSDELNLGKLQLSNRNRVGWLREFYTEIFKAHLKRISSEVAPKDITKEEDMAFPEEEDVPNEFVDREKIFDTASNRGIIVRPIYENELIALFFEMLGRGEIEGYQFYGLSGYDRYDGKTEYTLLSRTFFRNSIKQDSKLCSVEFKVRLSALINDIEDYKKRVGQLHLVIVWTVDTDRIPNGTDYRVVSWEDYETLSGYEFPEERLFPHVKDILAVLHDGRWIPIQIIEMQNIISLLVNDSS